MRGTYTWLRLALAGTLWAAALSAFADVPQAVLPISKRVPEATLEVFPMGEAVNELPITVAVSLKYRDLAAMEAFVDSVSSPKSPNYRKFLTPEEIGQRFGPSQEVVQAVRKHLTSAGMRIQLVGKNRLTVIAEGTVAQAERAFQTQITEFLPSSEHPAMDGVLYSFTKSISLPKAIQPYVLDVSGLENFTRPEPRGYMTPPIAQAVYGNSPLFAQGSKGQGRTIAISNWDGFRLSGLPPFYQQYNLTVPAGGVGSNVTVKTIDGGSGTGAQQGEGDLDIQAILGVSPLCNLIVYDGRGGNLINVLTYEANDNAADVISESWGWQMDINGKAAAHNLHLAMSAQGITYMAASGDTGTTLSYHYPNVEPEVLMVGGTTCNTDILGNRISEVGWSGSGGGWVVTADAFNRLPSYQAGTGVPTNVNYRLIPDVALNADPNTGYIVYMNGAFRVFGGTSAAAPTFAGSLGNAQQQLIKNGALSASGSGKYRHGRIQDLIYALNGNSSLFLDITSGTNGNLPSGSRSNATAAWDFVTGWGAMNFSVFVDFFSGSGLASLSISPSSVEGGQANAVGTVSMVGLAPSGGFTVNLSGGDSSISFPSSVTIPAGSSSTTFTITTQSVGTTKTETLTASDGTNTKTASFTLTPTTVTALAVSPTSAAGGATIRGTVTLARNAGASGVVVSLSGGDNKISYPATVTVPSGAKTVGFDITSSQVDATTSETITATVGSSSKSATFSLVPVTLTGLTFSPASVVSGKTVTGTVTLSTTAPVGGASVTLSGGDSSVSFPSSVTVAAGAKTATFTVTTQAIVGNKNITISATHRSSTKTATFTLTGAAISKLAFAPGTIYGGQSATGTITLTSAAPTGGVSVALSGGDSSVTYPATVTISGGATTGTFTVTSQAVNAIANQSIKATLDGKSATGVLVVRPTGIVNSLTFNPTSVPGGLSAVGTVKLAYAAGPGGVTVSLSGGDSNVSYPSTVSIAAGGTQATFTVTTTPVAANTNQSLRAAIGSVGANGSLTLLATAVSTFTLAPTSVFGGQSITGTITLNGPAGTGGATVTLSGGDSSVSYPATVTVPAGTTKATFSIATTTVLTQKTLTFGASLSVTKSAQAIIKPAGVVASLSFNPTSKIGGTTVPGTIKLTGPAGPGGVTVALSGGTSSISYPATVAIAAGASSANFTATLGVVSVNTPQTITATISPSKASGTVTILAPTLSSFYISPSSVRGGASAVGTLTLTGVAGTGGVAVTVTGGSSFVSYSATVTVPAGSNTVKFTIASSAVTANRSETLSAKLGTVTKSATLKLTP